jgi:hypothetical protein
VINSDAECHITYKSNTLKYKKERSEEKRQGEKYAKGERKINTIGEREVSRERDVEKIAEKGRRMKGGESIGEWKGESKEKEINKESSNCREKDKKAGGWK